MGLALPLRDQTLLLAAVFLAGLALGAAYDLLRVLRTGRGAAAAFVCDALFCLLFAAALFSLGLGPGRGRLRLFMPPLLLLGAAAWISLFGAAERNAARRGLRRAARAAAPLEKIRNSVKKWFTITKKWFTITLIQHRNGAARRRKAPEGTADETQTVQHIHQNRASGPDCLCDGQSCEHEKARRGGGGRPRGASGAG